MPWTPLDAQRLAEALALAEHAIGLSEPNPRVGCVLADRDGRIIGRGFTQRAGEAHAEIMALREARASGAELRGGTAWVTLEPCAHHGRTPPCCDALAETGLARVVVATGDPFPAVAGQGFARLRAAGIEVVLAEGAPVDAARELNIGFFSRIERGRPWVRLKVATSLDGFVALPDGRSQWITGPLARADGHAWRRRSGAVLTGIGTVLADDPRLDVRLVPSVLQPLRIVLDSNGRLPPLARVLQPPGQVLVVHARESAPPPGAECWTLGAADGRVDLAALLPALAARGVNELLVEGGAELSAALLAAGLVDELLLYVAPRMIGAGRRWSGATPFPGDPLAAEPGWRFLEPLVLGADLRLRARPAAPATVSGFLTTSGRANAG